MSILVTRPSPAGEELVSRLRTLGQVAWHFPLIEFSPGQQLPQLADQLAALGESDLLFALSQHAVAFAQSQLHQQDRKWPRLPDYFAIGLTDKNLLILRGNGGRELLGDTLRERGADVTFCECYQRCAIHYDGAEEAMRWQAREVTMVVVTSGEMLQQLWSLIPQWYREHWLLHCRLLVVSERLAKLARELGWQDIKVADNADNDALLRALQ